VLKIDPVVHHAEYLSRSIVGLLPSPEIGLEAKKRQGVGGLLVFVELGITRSTPGLSVMRLASSSVRSAEKPLMMQV
jgi:hypothetical protein